MKLRKLTAIALAVMTLPLATNAFATAYPEKHATTVYNAKVLTYRVTLNDSRARDVNWSKLREDARQLDHQAELKLRNTYQRREESNVTEVLMNYNLNHNVFEDALSKQGHIERASESATFVVASQSRMPIEMKHISTPPTSQACMGVQTEPSFMESRELVKVTPTTGISEKVIIGYDIQFSGKSRTVSCQEKEVPQTGYSNDDELSEYRRPAVTSVQTVRDEDLPVNRHAATTVIEQGETVAVSGFQVSTTGAEDAHTNEVTVVLIQVEPID